MYGIIPKGNELTLQEQVIISKKYPNKMKKSLLIFKMIIFIANKKYQL